MTSAALCGTGLLSCYFMESKCLRPKHIIWTGRQAKKGERGRAGERERKRFQEEERTYPAAPCLAGISSCSIDEIKCEIVASCASSLLLSGGRNTSQRALKLMQHVLLHYATIIPVCSHLK